MLFFHGPVRYCAHEPRLGFASDGLRAVNNVCDVPLQCMKCRLVDGAFFFFCLIYFYNAAYGQILVIFTAYIRNTPVLAVEAKRFRRTR